eukprot:gene7685-5390_t
MSSFGFVPMKIWLNEDEPEDPYKLYATRGIPKKPVNTLRLWVDGCFDMMHFGHANLLRQAFFLGMELNSNIGPVEVLAGCHSDAEIMKVKGPPIMKEDERYEALRACKWVNYVVENYPYCTRLKDMERFEVDFVVHGDDISVGSDGKNSYQEIMDAGKFKVVKRTESISTTELVGRMLLCTKDHQLRSLDDVQENHNFAKTNFLTTNRKILQFSNNCKPKPGEKIVYVDGGFDLFHVGHIHVLRQAKAMGDYLIVGLYEDSTINAIRGGNYPIMNLNERMLGLLSCRYVDEVILGVPFEVPEVLIQNFNISLVVRGKMDVSDPETQEKCYAVPKALNILVEVDSGYPLTTDLVIERVLNNRIAYLQRQSEKSIKDKKSEEMKPNEYRTVKEL